ncbi:MAG: hypothetical protein NVS1B10_04740 [Candidatus Saccharimonadales bacterium]
MLSNIASLGAAGIVAYSVLTYLRKKNLSIKLTLSLLFAAILLQIKYLSLHDNYLLIGQFIVIGSLIVLTASFKNKENLEDDSTVDNDHFGVGLPRKKSYLSLKAIIVLVIVLFFSGLGVNRFIDYTASPTQGKLYGLTDGSIDKSPPKDNVFESHYVSFKYPSGFTKNNISPARPPFVEIDEFLKSRAKDGDLAIQIEKLPSGKLNDDGSYRFREINPGRFEETIESINGADVHIMTDHSLVGEFAKVAFFMHNDLLASVALTSSSPPKNDPNGQIYNQVLQSWRWK